MPDSIRNGDGGGWLARVSENLRLYVQALTVTEQEESTKKGDAYNINTGVITLTDAAETPVLYVKNNETRSIHISAIAVGVSPTTGGTGGIPKITVIRNPTAGTIIDNASAVAINTNRNFGSPRTLAVSAYKGATGDTMTDGDDHILFYQTSNGRLFAAISELVPQGSSIGIKFDPQTGNTSQDVYAAIICHLEDDKD